MTKIILNADDFGRSHARNQAVDDAFRQGLICSAGLIVTGKHLLEAVELMSRGGYVDHVHLHFNLSTSKIQEDSDDIPLTEEMRKDSFFSTDGKFSTYHGLPHRFSDIRRWRVVYDELVAQYNRFVDVTGGKGNLSHIDFHLWYNLTWPVSVALARFTRKYNIRTVRYIGQHQAKRFKYRRYLYLSKDPNVRCVPATNIDYYLSKRDSFAQYETIELYSHPNYKEGVFLDDSPSYLKHERQPLVKHFRQLEELDGVEFISWEQFH